VLISDRLLGGSNPVAQNENLRLGPIAAIRGTQREAGHDVLGDIVAPYHAGAGAADFVREM
jgi:hypothetical protein